MAIRVRVDAKAAFRALDTLRKQIPYATATAINQTLKHAQKAQQQHQRTVFTVRNRVFVDRAVKIKPFATKTSTFGVIQVDPPGGQARASILTQHEQGGTKRPRGSTLWAPEPKGETPVKKIRRGGRGVPKGSGWRPKELGLVPHGKTGRVWKGKNRTFLIKTGSRSGVVFQRTGKGRSRASNIRTRTTSWRGRRSGVRILYALFPQGNLRPRLGFERVVVSTIHRVYRREFDAAMTRAIKTAR
jgi:hypothetical protein